MGEDELVLVRSSKGRILRQGATGEAREEAFQRLFEWSAATARKVEGVPESALILIRANAKATGPAKALLQVIQQSGARLVLSPYVLDEIQRVLRYPRIQALYNLSDGDIWEYVRLLESIYDIVEPAEGPPVVLKDLTGVELLHVLRRATQGG